MGVHKTIAILEGDGIGPEITREGLKVLDAVSAKYGHTFELNFAPFGANAYFQEGHPFPEKTKTICDYSDSILKGPIGLDVSEMKKRIPEELWPEAAALLPLRKRYETYANLRPVYLPASCADFSPLKREIIGDGLDILMIRELVGDIYFGPKEEGRDTGMKYAQDDCTYTREQVERIAHFAFKEAQKGGKKLVNVHKKNVLATSRYWCDIIEGSVVDGVVIEEGVAKKYPDVKVESVLVDNLAYQLIVNPSQYNKSTVLLKNMQGDIITDEAGGILGSLGLMPSACLNPETGRGYFEPAHGSAPSIAGKNSANPYSMIGSVAYMLERSFGLDEEAKDIWDGLSYVFGKGYRTSELKSPGIIVGTSEFGDLVRNYILNGHKEAA